MPGELAHFISVNLLCNLEDIYSEKLQKASLLKRLERRPVVSWSLFYVPFVLVPTEFAFPEERHVMGGGAARPVFERRLLIVVWPTDQGEDSTHKH